ncbi:MAG TPA: 2-C-methyl-D-erythritol 2,4-cyclodiphosphate synthase [Acidobacteriota bacterium]|jgi:2-C-methyl-D-erythritol 2,4-cyclodiphosphate synthase
MIRTGIGFDFHRLVSGRKLILGGVEIRYERGLEGHSDADVVLHAICDALLGAAGLEDIGYYFPDSDPRFKNISSLELLKQVAAKIHQYGFEVANIDSMLLMEAPRIAPFRQSMKQNIASALNISVSQVGLKATTFEGSGMIGRGEGIAAQAIATLRDAGTQGPGDAGTGGQGDAET